MIKILITIMTIMTLMIRKKIGVVVIYNHNNIINVKIHKIL